MLVRLNNRVMSHQHLFVRTPETTAAAAAGLKMITTINKRIKMHRMLMLMRLNNRVMTSPAP
jgi:hypothetical protein